MVQTNLIVSYCLAANWRGGICPRADANFQTAHVQICISARKSIIWRQGCAC